MGPKQFTGLLALLFTFASVYSFQLQPCPAAITAGGSSLLYQQSTKRVPSTILNANEKEDYLPESQFGAEVVPEGQRPINEYMDMTQAPLFGWASNDVGTSGVSTMQDESMYYFYDALCFSLFVQIVSFLVVHFAWPTCPTTQSTLYPPWFG